MAEIKARPKSICTLASAIAIVLSEAAGGLAEYLKDYDKEPSIVIGYDGRKNSDVFARDTAEIMAGAGVKATRNSRCCTKY